MSSRRTSSCYHSVVARASMEAVKSMRESPNPTPVQLYSKREKDIDFKKTPRLSVSTLRGYLCGKSSILGVVVYVIQMLLLRNTCAHARKCHFPDDVCGVPVTVVSWESE